ncbi:MAG: hypothetical protein GX329_06440 [Tissierellia bacterium]|nr:hypothetical protein [Tissierellia bacterium]
MRRFLEKLFISILCLYNTYIINPTMDLVFLFLSSLILSLLLDLFQDRRYRSVIYIVFILACIWNGQYVSYLPLILYNLYLDFRLYALIVFPLLLIEPSILILALAILSIYLSAIANKYNILLDDNKIIRDSLIEDTLYLKKFNEQLKVDREKNIHIAILTERNRIARELHDSIGHAISSSILQVEALKMIPHEKDTIDSLNILQDTLKNGMQDIRKSIHNLYSESLDLEDRIYRLGEDFPGLDIELNYGIADELNHDLKFDILSIIKEAMTNCAKHSNADRLSIHLLEQPKFYSIIIEDNGSNFDHGNDILDKGIGLSSMKEIASKHNGFLNYGFDKGFKIHITLMKG